MAMRSLYIMGSEAGVGSSFVALGLMEVLKRTFKRVAIFKPIIEDANDEEIKMLQTFFGMHQSYQEALGLEVSVAESLLSQGEEQALYEQLIARFEQLRAAYDFVLCVGVYPKVLARKLSYDLHLKIAKNLATPVVGVFGGDGGDMQEVKEAIILWQRSLKAEGLVPFALFVNRASDQAVCNIEHYNPFPDTPCFAIPYDAKLDQPTVLDLIEAVEGEVIHLKDRAALERPVGNLLVAAMHPEHFLGYLKDQDVVIVPADRSDLLMTVMSLNRLAGYPTPSVLLFSGHFRADERIMQMIEADDQFQIAIAQISCDTFEVAQRAKSIKAKITLRHRRKIDRALGLFARYVAADLIEERLESTKLSIVTPTMFLHRIFAQAATLRKRIVLPEGEDERILKAAERLQHRKIAQVILLGNPTTLHHRCATANIDLEGVEIIDIAEQKERKERYAHLFYDLRKAKGVTLEMAHEIIEDPTYFATMMVHEGYADAMVSGASHTTRETVRPALQIIKTKPGVDIVSSIFFMCLDTKVLVYGDCAIVPDPTPRELAQIAIESARTAQAFGIEPRVAMLSYSTGESGVGEEVQKVREATRIAQTLAADLLIEGPMQYDAAIDPNVAKKKMPNSKVAGRATVFVFPDLNTGNNTYKAVQRSTGAIAVGPVLQGLNKPVNDLSRGCSVDDIVSTVAISAIQAEQAAKGEA